MESKLYRANCLIKFMDYDYLTEAEHDLTVKIESYISSNKKVSDKQLDILEEINERANLRDRPIKNRL